MAEIRLNDVDIKFPFKPYQVQEDYMTKVLECLQQGKNGVLESPTGTGKTLSLLCSSLAWLLVRKAQIQMQAQNLGALDQVAFGNDFINQTNKKLNRAVGAVAAQNPNVSWSLPKIIYASRTHSQLSQAMKELKRTSYHHVNVAVLGSRDQLCIHPEVAKESNTANKIHMCQAKLRARSCHYYNNVELRKDDPSLKESILDIEDLVKNGQKLRCCPYFLSKELKQNADIIFMPYNYLLDPKTRRSQGIDLQSNVVLLDEAHNVEKMCEEAASLQISSTDIAVCIDEITHVMKDMEKEEDVPLDFTGESTGPPPKDFSADDLCVLKAMFLELEKAIDAIPIRNQDEGDTYPGTYFCELLAKADLTQGKDQLVIDKLEKIILYLTTTTTSLFNKKGNALQKFSDTLRVVFAGSNNANYREKVKKCYKVYIQNEQPKKSFKKDAWESKKIVKSGGKLISYWCFSPGFGMQQLLDQGVRSVILTSGTLSPLKPFISEIAIDIGVKLENPHIVTEKQVCVGIISNGSDGYTLNSSFNTRNDPKYIASLGDTIKILSCILPAGLLVFFPSYPIMKKCQEEWQRMGKWTEIENSKSIFVEPQSKETFNSVMHEYYRKIQDPMCRGAVFMAVCRGKVSEGLDFANANGRAVLITGLPFPPLKDPRVILKQRYLDENRSSNGESLTGQQWYQLEASRAVNQAIGRIIRHKNDYGAILLCDCRFENPSFKQQLSAWIRPQIKKFQDFKTVVKELKGFFKYAKENLPQPNNHYIGSDDYSLPAVQAQFYTGGIRKLKSSSATNKTTTNGTNDAEESFDIDSYRVEGEIEEKHEHKNHFGTYFEAKQKKAVNFATCKLEKSEISALDGLKSAYQPATKKRKVIKIKPMNFNLDAPMEPCQTQKTHSSTPNQEKTEQITNKLSAEEFSLNYLKGVKHVLTKENLKTFKQMAAAYRKDEIFEELLLTLEQLFMSDNKRKDLFLGYRRFLKKEHLLSFDEHVKFLEDSGIC